MRRIRARLTGACLIMLFSSPLWAQNISPSAPATADTAVGRVLEAPVNTLPAARKFWWNEDWYERGILETPVNRQVVERETSYVNPADQTEVPAVLFRPKGSGRFPGVLFQHGRRGLDDLVRRLARRIAARGFVVLAPDVYAARFIARYPVKHLDATETDVSAGVDYLLGQPDVSTSKICLVSHTRGGYYTLKVATRLGRQETDVACYVSSYPHWQHPAAPEPMQVYRYDTDADKLAIPALIFIGEYEQYQRRRSIEAAVSAMKQAGKDVRLIIYPGVGRGFDFRPENVRTFADDLASKDMSRRMAAFMRKHLLPALKR